MILFYSIFIITTNQYKQLLDGIHWFFNILLNKKHNYASTAKNNVKDESNIINDYDEEIKKKETSKTIIVKKKYYLNVEKKIVIRQQHNYYLVLGKREEPIDCNEPSDEID
jgi:hypothetical protein